MESDSCWSRNADDFHIVKTAILYVTFARDIVWLDYSLQSIRKFGSGFSEICIVVPTNDVDRFIKFEKSFGTAECPVRVKTFLEYPQKGFVHHLAMKCYADAFIPDADLILHMDPDCMFHAPFSPSSYIVNGRPELVIEPYEAIRQSHPPRYNWKSVTEDALRFPCNYETMCRHPAIHHSWLYPKARKHIEMVHGTPFIDFVLKQKNSFPQGFGEFNTLGSYAIDRHPESYHLIDRGNSGESADPKPLLTQMWSYTGVRQNMAKIREILNAHT